MMRRLILSAGFVFMCAAPAHAVSVDVSSDVIRVTTGFSGAELTVFGTQDKPGNIVLVVEGPPRTMTVRRKSNVGGLWTNTETRSFANVQTFYEVAAAGPIDTIAAPEILREHRIGTQNLSILTTKGKAANEKTQPFLDALYQRQQDKNLFAPDAISLTYSGPALFKARFTIPALVTPGQYKVSAYLFADGRLIEQSSVPFTVVPEGLSADLRRFATQNGPVYGFAGMMMAMVAGWLATVLLKRD